MVLKMRSNPHSMVFKSCRVPVQCRIAFQGWLMTLPRDKIRICWVVQKSWFSAFEKGTKNDWNTSSFPYPSKIAIGSDLTIHQMSIRRGFKPFQLKKLRSVQKFGHSGSDRLSPANLPKNPLLSWWKAELSPAN